MSSLITRPIDHPNLLLGPDEFSAIKEKVATQPWAKEAYDNLIARVDAITNITISDRKGQWMHYYACPEDGTHLQTVTPTEHKCSTCGKIYTGDPYDSVVIRNRHMQNGDDAVDLALAGHLSGEQHYIDRAKEIVLDYADRYLSYPWHDQKGEPNKGGRVFCTHLNESNWLITMSWAYDLVAAELTDAQCRHVCDDFLIQGANIVLTPRRNIHNIMCWRNSGAGLAALCAGDQDIASITVDSETGLHQQIAQGVLDDGMWWEGSWGYHFYTMQAIWPLVEAVKRQGVEIDDDRYRGLFDAPIRFAFPNGTLPPLNDSGSGTVLPARCEPMEIAYSRYGDPAYAGVLAKMDRRHRMALCFGSDLPDSATKPESETRNFASAGVVILRSPTSDTNVTLDYGPHGGGHGHPDKLGIILYAKDRILVPDPGSIQYAVPLHLEWFKQTISHNTVLIDGVSQEACTGELTRLDTDGDIQVASAVAHDAYPGVSYGRTIALAPSDLILDVFRVASDTEHTYDWMFHCKGAFATDLSLVATDSLGSDNGFQHVESPHRAATDEAWSATWNDNDAGVALAVLGEPGTEVITGLGRGNPPANKLPMIFVRRTAKVATYVAAYTVYDTRTPSLAIEADQDATSIDITVTLAGNTTTVSLPLPF